MSLGSGTRLGPYEVLAPLGAGGMGEVFRARDTRLGRDVAVKVLPDQLAGDAKALARFESEAKAVAALSHPNILALFDIGETDGVRYAVTELLEGETLRALVTRGALPLKRALEIAFQVASALAAAHEKGILHRDVKPENVFLSKDGHVKLLDFGLARNAPGLGSGSDTRSPTEAALTETGAIVGTVAYMSPEQARGEPIDFRSDQFSLGTTLYEMLAGRRPFQGTSAVDLLAAIVRDEPERLAERAPTVPGPVRWIVERLLAKDPADRYAATRDLAADLSSVRSHLTETVAATPALSPTLSRRAFWTGAGLVVAGAAVALVAASFFRARPAPQAPRARLEVQLPEGQFLARYRQAFDVSADGKILVFSAFAWKTPYVEQGEGGLFLRPLDGFDARPIPGTAGAFQPFFSPDGRWIAFSQGQKEVVLKKVAVAGGEPVKVCDCFAL